ncbi:MULTISPECIES: bestrophin family ion channel [unclassified Microcoleus]|uniref:bestrophin family ion channel n=1 Tax=unclassified Microcoleus TaxID=2642155 RepID=UPI002FD59039
MSGDRPSWFKIALQVRGSVIPSILPRVLLCGGFGVFISFLYFFNLPVSLPILSSIVPSIVLGLLLVFRTNTAYERFWEGRRLWGTLNNNIRNLARQIWVAIEEKDPQDIIEKKSALRLLVALAVAMKLHLRQESVNPELEPLMSPAQYQKLKSMNNPPLEVAFWIEDYMHEQYERNCVDVYQLTGMNELLNSMIDVLGGCERILKTPIPLAYAIHLKQLLLLYSLALPFQMVKDLGWGTGPVVALISFTLFGIEEIGIEIENPFGRDANDLPLDNMCAAMQRNMDDLISLSPSVHQHLKDK